MTTPLQDGDPRAAEARRMRAETRISLAQLERHFGVSRNTMAAWLWNEPTPEWTRRPNAKDDLRAKAIELRQAGSTVPGIAAELGVSKSTAYLWVRHLPLDKDSERERRKEHGRRINEARWAPHRLKRDADHAAVNGAAASWVGSLSDREVRLLGAVAYWCEGTKAKPWRPNDTKVVFINSDPALILLFIRFLEGQGEDRAKLTYRVSIHESPDVQAASRWWADVVGVPVKISGARPSRRTIRPPSGTTSGMLTGVA